MTSSQSSEHVDAAAPDEDREVIAQRRRQLGNRRKLLRRQTQMRVMRGAASVVAAITTIAACGANDPSSSAGQSTTIVDAPQQTSGAATTEPDRAVTTTIVATATDTTTTASDGGSVGDNEWTLEGASPDGLHLLVSTPFGRCDRFDGWEVTESVDAVDIRARLWTASAPVECTAELLVDILQIDLDESLADRRLLGCGADDCRNAMTEFGALVSSDDAAATDTAVAVAGDAGVDVYSSEGELLRTSTETASGPLVPSGGDVILRTDRDRVTSAVDLPTGEQLWETTGNVTTTGAGTVYVCRGFDSDGLAAIDSSTGEDLWATDLPCDPLAIHVDLATFVSFDPDVDGGTRIVVIDVASGVVVSEAELNDGFDDRVNGFSDAVAIGESTLTTGFQSNLVILDRDGTEIHREPDGIGILLGASDGVAILASDGRALGYSVEERGVLWSVDVAEFSRIAVGDTSVWLLDESGETVSRLDPRTGRTTWTTPVGLTTEFDVAARSDIAYVVTNQAIIALDDASGEVLWSRHRPWTTPE